MDILIATHNKGKAKELEYFLKGLDVKVLTLKDIGYDKEIIENGNTFEENSLIKAKVASSLGYIGIADDSGLCVDYLSGKPGVYSARYSGEDANDEKNMAKLLLDMKDAKEDERGAKFVSVISCVIPYEKEIVISAKGECHGQILFEKRGTNGFGYDPLFYYEPYKKTFAEMNENEKNTISHRAKAIENFMEKFLPILKGTNDNK